MKNKDLIKLLQSEDPEAQIEFVYYGNHFNVNGLVHYDPQGYNAIELYGNPMHNMEILYNEEDYK